MNAIILGLETSPRVLASVGSTLQTLHDDEDRNKDLSTNVETDGDVKFLYEKHN